MPDVSKKPVTDVDLTLKEVEILETIIEDYMDMGLWDYQNHVLASAKEVQALAAKLLLLSDRADFILKEEEITNGKKS